MSGFVFDLSFGWPTITGDKIKAAGASGVIGYAGCLNTEKNVSRARFRDWLDSGLMVGLVIEDIATDAIGGLKVGQDQGARLADAADALGYDADRCVLFGGYDTDAHPGDYGHLLDYMHGLASACPVAGYYGDSDSIDYLHNHGGVDWIFWQSSSSSFSPRNPTPLAHLHQLWADHRARGLDVDVNDVLRTPLRLMGEDDMLSAQEIAQVATAVWALQLTDGDGTKQPASAWLKQSRNLADHADGLVKAVNAKIDALPDSGLTKAAVSAAAAQGVQEFFAKVGAAQ